ncbi:MAG: methyltransferase [Gemmatimonadetes bacterium]|nr:methyltransferase [Gemmatimonadota bacterium]
MLKSPTSVCAVAPSSRTLARAMAKGLTIGDDESVVELGPGTGALTDQIRHILPHDGGYLGIEIEPRFVDLLRKRYPGLRFEQNTVAKAFQLHANTGTPPVRAVISGLSISTMPSPVIDEIIANLDRLMRPGTVFRMFQYLHAYYLPASIRFRRRMAPFFSCYRVESVVLKNLPPALVMTWTR